MGHIRVWNLAAKASPEPFGVKRRAMRFPMVTASYKLSP